MHCSNHYQNNTLQNKFCYSVHVLAPVDQQVYDNNNLKTGPNNLELDLGHIMNLNLDYLRLLLIIYSYLNNLRAYLVYQHA